MIKIISRAALVFLFIIAWLLGIHSVCRAQSANNEHTRFDFAKMYVGLDLTGMPAGGQASFLNDEIQTYSVGTRLFPRLLIGAIHFWDHADFFVNFPVATLAFHRNDAFKANYQPGIETGALIYPWPIQKGMVRPFIGASWSSIDYGQKVQPAQKGPALSLSRIYLKGGFLWQSEMGLWEIGASYLTNHAFRYPLSRNRFTAVELPRWSFKLSYKYLFDTTNGYENRATPRGVIPERIRKYRDSRKLNAFSVSIGLSTAFTLSPSPYNQTNRPYVDDPTQAALFPDISLGYYFYDFDSALRLSFRSITQNQSAFGIEQQFRRCSFAVEAIKFLSDYQGFVPFIGPFISLEYLKAKEFDNGRQILDLSESKVAWGITFGWDIRPVRTPGLVLRTNLRYTPGLSITAPDGNEILFNQLEVNFIQLVIYPERLF